MQLLHKKGGVGNYCSFIISATRLLLFLQIISLCVPGFAGSPRQIVIQPTCCLIYWRCEIDLTFCSVFGVLTPTCSGIQNIQLWCLGETERIIYIICFCWKYAACNILQIRHILVHFENSQKHMSICLVKPGR